MVLLQLFSRCCSLRIDDDRGTSDAKPGCVGEEERGDNVVGAAAAAPAAVVDVDKVVAVDVLEPS